MTRDELEAGLWAVTGRELTGSVIDAIVALAETYASELPAHRPRTVLHHATGTDLWPIIGALADAMLNPASADEPAPVPLKLIRGAA
jgi:hypothetical protein